MTFAMIFKRIRREWRLLSILLFAVSLITGFFALGPLFIRTVTEADLRYILGNASPDELRLLVNSNAPLTADDQRILEDELGTLLVDITRYKRASYSPPTVSSNQSGVGGIAGTAVCGFDYTLGVPPGSAGSTAHCYQPFAFDDLTGRVTLVEGRMPVRKATPDMVNATGFTDEQQQELQLGLYNRSEVEAIVTDTVAEEANLEVGSRFYIGYFDATGNGAVSRVEVVGIVHVENPSDRFWEGNLMFVQGALVEIDNLGTLRYDFGMAFEPAAYDDWVVRALPLGVSTNHIWRLNVDETVIDSTNAQDYNATLVALPARLSVGQRSVSLATALTDILGGYDKRVANAEGPIILLSAAILIMMLYHLITTVTLVLQQQGKEWSTITSRGGSAFQLLKLQAVTVLALSVVAFVLGPLLSRGFMFFMERVGPLAAALDGVNLGAIALPSISIYLSLAAALACVTVLSLPSLGASRRSLLLLKQAASRPPTSPAWARYMVDLIFVLLGTVLLFRLYWIVSGDKSLSSLFRDLIETPDQVVKFIADRASETSGLTDPFNLLAPALILTGIALFWLRLFPMLMRFVSRLTSHSSRLATPLAVWNVERDPGHYAQLVLLLIGTLALGTASLGLSATRDVGGWSKARQDTGGTVNVSMDSRLGGFEDTHWERFDGVSGVAPLLVQRGVAFRDQVGAVNIVGVDVERFSEAFPDYAELIESLEGDPVPHTGIELPFDAAELQVQVWSTAIGSDALPEPSIRLKAYIQDADGVPITVVLTQVAVVSETDATSSGQATPTISRPPTTPERWISFSGRIPTVGKAPYRLWRVGIDSQQADLTNFSHTLYLDYWQAIDSNGTATPIESQDDPALWQSAVAPLPYVGAWYGYDVRQIAADNVQFVSNTSGEPVFDGDRALRVDYQIVRSVSRSNEPSIGVNLQTLDRVPAVVSSAFAVDFRASLVNSRTPNLEVGDSRDIVLDLPSGRISFGLAVTDIIDTFPTLSDEDAAERNFIILPMDTAKLLLNQGLLGAPSLNNIADVNTVWLELENRRPSDELKGQLNAVPSVTGVNYAWDEFGAILREPLPSAVAGILFAGFWVSLILSLLDFAFYIAVTAKQRSFTFGVLRSLGWNANNIWQMLLIEQITLVTPALAIGSLLGAGLAYLLLPFLSLVGSATLRVPLLDLIGLNLTLIIGFSILLIFTALWLRRMSVNQVLRLGEE